MSDQPQLSEEQIRSLLSGTEDLLTPVAEKAIPSPRTCDHCGGRMLPVVDPNQPFLEGELMPNYLLECPACHMQVSTSGSTISNPYEPLDL